MKFSVILVLTIFTFNIAFCTLNKISAELSNTPINLPRKECLPFKIYSSPKTGVNLLFSLLDKLVTLDPRPRHTHFYPSRDFFVNCADKNEVVLVTIRDVRDQMVSAAHYFHKLNKYPKNIIDQLKLPKSSDPLTHAQVQMLLSAFIKKMWPTRNNWPNDFMWSFKDSARIYEEAPEGVCFVRFENLVGELGGGNREAQQREMQKIANHLGIFLTQTELDDLSNRIFGDSKNFHKGKIGTWREYFTKPHIEEFKKNFGGELIILGYESNVEWGIGL